MEETAALEHMVQQVEATLTTTTVRSKVLSCVHDTSMPLHCVTLPPFEYLHTYDVSLKSTPLYCVHN